MVSLLIRGASLPKDKEQIFVIFPDGVVNVVEKGTPYYEAVEVPDHGRTVVRGEWTTRRTFEHDGEWWCTACGEGITIYMGEDRADRYDFCPHCGAVMRPGKEETDGTV